MSAASNHKIYFLLQRVSHRLRKKADQIALEAGGLTAAQAAVLSIIIKQGSSSQAHIAKTLSQRESAITTMAARLVAAGYITKAKSDADRRSMELRSTKKGRQALAEMAQSLAQVNAIIESNVSQERLNEFASCLIDILGELDVDGEPD